MTTDIDRSKYLIAGDDISNLNIYEIINKYFGKNYKGWMKAWYNINDYYAAWFPRITKTNSRPNGHFGGTRNCSNTLSADWSTIIEIDHDSDASLEEVASTFYKTRLVFARINGKFHFLGIFNRTIGVNGSQIIKMHNKIAEGINLETFELYGKVDDDNNYRNPCTFNKHKKKQ